jgi:hypothetical protein
VPVVLHFDLVFHIEKGMLRYATFILTYCQKRYGHFLRIKTGTISLLHGATRPLVARTKASMALPDLGFINVILNDR